MEEQIMGEMQYRNTSEQLQYLMQSELVRLVLSGKYTPQQLDSAFKNLRKRVQNLEHTHQLDLTQAVAYRRQIEFLTERQ